MKGQSEHKDLKKKFERYSHPVDGSNWEAISRAIPSGKGSGILASKFDNYQLPPSAQVWNNIDVAINPSARKRPVAWWWYAAAASFLIIVFIGYSISNSENDQKFITQNTEHNQEKPTEEKKSGRTEPASGASNSEASKYVFSERAKTQNSTEVSIDENDIASPERSALKSEKDDMKNPFAERDQNTTDSRKTSETVLFENNAFEKAKTISERMHEANVLDARIGIELASATLTAEKRIIQKFVSAEQNKKSSPFYDGAETASANDFSLLAGSQLAFSMGDGNNESFDLASPPFSNVISDSLNSLYTIENFTGKSSYSTPVYYAINGEIKFWKRLSAGSGLGYLRMERTKRSYDGQGGSSIQENTAYLSIPVYLKFNFINTPKFASYVSVGHAYDLQVWQKTESAYNRNGQITTNDATDQGENGNQANVYGGMGINLKFTEHFGIFAEGSLMQYYHLNSENFYAQQSYWPGFRFGALITF